MSTQEILGILVGLSGLMGVLVGTFIAHLLESGRERRRVDQRARAALNSIKWEIRSVRIAVTPSSSGTLNPERKPSFAFPTFHRHVVDMAPIVSDDFADRLHLAVSRAEHYSQMWDTVTTDRGLSDINRTGYRKMFDEWAVELEGLEMEIQSVASPTAPKPAPSGPPG